MTQRLVDALVLAAIEAGLILVGLELYFFARLAGVPHRWAVYCIPYAAALLPIGMALGYSIRRRP